MSNRGSLGRPSWFELEIGELEDTRIMLLVSQLGLEGYGIHVMLRLFLAKQADYRAPIKIIPALATRYATTQAKIESVITGYKLYVVIKDKGRIFFSPELSSKLSRFDQKCIENVEKGKISAQKRELERKAQLEELGLALSVPNSSQPWLDNCLTYNTENKKENKESLSKERIRTFFDNTKDLKKHLIDKYNNTSETWEGVASYESLSIRNGYLHNNVVGKDLQPDEALIVWNELMQLYRERGTIK